MKQRFERLKLFKESCQIKPKNKGIHNSTITLIGYYLFFTGVLLSVALILVSGVQK